MISNDQILRFNWDRDSDDFRTFSDNDLIRLATYAVAEHESLDVESENDRFVIAEIYRELRAHPPEDCGGSIEIEAYGNTYMLATTDSAIDLANDIINEHADEQEAELDRTLAINGVCTTYVNFNRDMFVQDCGFDWAEYLVSYDGVVNEIFTKEWDSEGIARSLEVYSIWRTD